MSMIYNQYYLLSENVRVYPCAFRGQFSEDIIFDPESRLNTEANFILPRANGDIITSYVISFVPTSAGNPDVGTLTCVIGGYYFELRNFDLSDLFDNPNAIKQLYINTRQVSLTPDSNENQPKTRVLASFVEESPVILDYKVSEGAQPIFTGLYIGFPSQAPTHTASLDVIEYNSITQNYQIKESSYLPKILHGIGKDSLVLVNGSATGENAIAHGNDFTLASGKNAIALGVGESLANKSIAQGENSLTLGLDTKAIGANAIALGRNSGADGDSSIAFGSNSHANSNYSIAGGVASSTNGVGASAIGLGLDNPNDYSFVVGKYNSTLSTGDIFVVGDGAFANQRSNAFVVNTDKIKLNHSTDIAGSVEVTGGATFGGAIGVLSGGATIDGNVNITNGTITSADKLTVSNGGADITGNVKINFGTLTSANKLTVSSGGADIIGDVTASGTLSTGNKLTVGSGGADIKGTTRITGSFAVSGAAQVRSLKATATDGIGVTAKNIEVSNELKIGDTCSMYIADDGSLRIRIVE